MDNIIIWRTSLSMFIHPDLKFFWSCPYLNLKFKMSSYILLRIIFLIYIKFRLKDHIIPIKIRILNFSFSNYVNWEKK